ncbi:hypothetical protein [Bdellovibrio sp. NC01]|uniref:hypothetical protein n=1 Tax=Bdellovibrio sp. NC01 TaxID=2220073 RepID=UPI00115B2AD7|nr:hypothetical protein [Bdellovibrio sp. NC01]QDK36299.1 hypothetical protein DOE51_01135 [Bdellovibrio sp. NC01]
MATPSNQLQNSMNGKKSLNDLKDTFSRGNIDVDEIKSELQHGVSIAADKAQEYAKSATSFARKNPLYVALGVAGIGLLVGGLVALRKRK